MANLIFNIVDTINELKENSLISAWIEAKKSLDAVKQLEMDLRKELIAQQFANAGLGVSKCDSELGKLVLTKGLSYKVNEAELVPLIEKFESEFIDVGTLFKVKHELSVKEFKNLTEEQKNLVSECLTITEKAPDLKLVVAGDKE